MPRSPECTGHLIAEIVLLRLETKHLKLTLLVACDNVQSPAPSTHIVDRRPELREVQRMPAVENMNRGDQDDALGKRRQAGRHDQRVGRALAEFHLAAVATLSHPLGQPEDKVEAELFGKRGATRIIIERPRCPPRRSRRAPSSRLKWQEQPKDQRVLRRVLDGSDLGTLCRHVFHPEWALEVWGLQHGTTSWCAVNRTHSRISDYLATNGFS